MVPPYIVRPALLLVAMVAAHAAGLPMEAKTAVAAAIVATWGAGLVQTLLMDRRLGGDHRQRRRQYDFPRVAADELAAARHRRQRVRLQSADVLVVSHYMTPTDVGIYFAAAKTMSLILFVHYAVGSAVGQPLRGARRARRPGEPRQASRARPRTGPSGRRSPRACVAAGCSACRCCGCSARSSSTAIR